MKLFMLVTFILFTFISGVFANEKRTAWTEDGHKIISAPYVYGAVRVTPNAIHALAKNPDAPEDDPFSEENPGKPNIRLRSLDQIAPKVPRSSIPECLPLVQSYRDISKLLIKNGVAIKGKEWALLSSGMDTDQHLYFCTTPANADIINILFNYRCCGSRSISQLTSLVSVQPKHHSSIPWTARNLAKHSPVIHARYGCHGRSGEKIWICFKTHGKKTSSQEMEPTIGEGDLLMDCRLDYSLKLPEPDVLIAQNTAITTNTGTPFVLDCGIHGKGNRHYFLVIHSKVETSDTHHPNKEIIPVQKIAGIYEIHPQRKKSPEDTALAFATHWYSVDPRFLIHLKNKVDEYRYQNNDDPFSIEPLAEPRQGPPAPVRVIPPKQLRHHKSDDRIFDITPHLVFLELRIYQGEKIYYNQTQHQLILHGSPGLQNRTRQIVEGLVQTPRQVRVTADIVLVDHKKLDWPAWTIMSLKQSNPKYIARYAATARSGEKGTAGKINLPPYKDPKTGKERAHYTHNFEIEPTN